MFKIFKQIQANIQSSRINGQGAPLNNQGPSNLGVLFSKPLMLVGAVVATVFFSALLSLLMIPLGIAGYLMWRRLNQLSKQAAQAPGDVLDGEFKVVNREAGPNIDPHNNP